MMMAGCPRLLSRIRAFSTSSVGVAWKELQATRQTSSQNKPVESGQIVRVNYVTRKALSSDGFDAGDALLDSGRLDFRLGNAKFGAFDEVIPGMRVGDLRRVRAPHTMAYGVNGKPPAVAPFEEVMFDGAPRPRSRARRACCRVPASVLCASRVYAPL
jgi:FKBP-type peptidyl-prolyl cis-trans isomerase